MPEMPLLEYLNVRFKKVNGKMLKMGEKRLGKV